MLFDVYNFPKQLTFARGEGAYLMDAKGRRYLDFTSGIGVNCLGHCHPRLVDVLKRQSERVWHTSNLFANGLQEKTAALLEKQFGRNSRSFFCNSGNEAVDSGIKLVRRYWRQKGEEKSRIICFSRSFHGRGMAAISASGQQKLTEGYAPLLPGFEQVPFGNLEATKRAMRPDTAAILLEPIQGEGGIHIAQDEFLKGLRSLCDRAGALLFCDEVQCGVARSGEFFAHRASGIKADVVTLAKGLGGGFPVGACLASAEVAKGFGPGSHGSTFGGNPMAMAVAAEVLEIVGEPKFLAGVKKRGRQLLAGLTALGKAKPKSFGKARGRGLMLGLECRPPVGEFIVALRTNGLLLAPASGNVLRLLPPLIIGEEEIEDALTILRRTAE